jgi:hypothetical protein
MMLPHQTIPTHEETFGVRHPNTGRMPQSRDCVEISCCSRASASPHDGLRTISVAELRKAGGYARCRLVGACAAFMSTTRHEPWHPFFAPLHLTENIGLPEVTAERRCAFRGLRPSLSSRGPRAATATTASPWRRSTAPSLPKRGRVPRREGDARRVRPGATADSASLKPARSAASFSLVLA